MSWSKTSRHSRGYGASWDRLRKTILARDLHLCQPCLATGRPTPAVAVDHIIPKAAGGDDNPANLQAICGACHDAKTNAENGRKTRPTIGPDGWPLP